MRLIPFDTIDGLSISPRTCCTWVEEALRLKYSSLLPAKTSLKPDGLPNVFYNTMPCLIPQISRGGLKLVTRYPGREPALDSEILLHDLDSGECLALMDGDWITTMRTGAVAAHSITLLAKPGFTRVGFIGLGNTARSTLLCLRDHVPGKRLEIGLLRYKDQHEGFQQRFSSMRDVAFSEFDDVSEMAGWCDVLVSCVTAADGDFCEPDSFDPGTLVVPVHTRGFAGCDLVFDRVFVDDVAHVSDFKHFERFKSKMTETAEVVTGSKPGREDDAERILAYNIGIALHDIYFASRIEQLLEGCPGIDELPMGKPQEKFWV